MRGAAALNPSVCVTGFLGVIFALRLVYRLLAFLALARGLLFLLRVGIGCGRSSGIHPEAFAGPVSVLIAAAVHFFLRQGRAATAGDRRRHDQSKHDSLSRVN